MTKLITLIIIVAMLVKVALYISSHDNVFLKIMNYSLGGTTRQAYNVIDVEDTIYYEEVGPCETNQGE
jgi:hypothetical protein